MATAVTEMRQELEFALNGIKEKIPGDDKWFYIQDKGRLGLYERPKTWRLAIECFKRIIYAFQGINPYEALDFRIREITLKVNDYLTQEKDMKALNLFLQKYNPALNELFTAQEKFARLRKLPLPDYSLLRGISDLVALEKDYGVAQRKVELIYMNKSPDRRVYFTIESRKFSHRAPVLPGTTLEYKALPTYYHHLQETISLEDGKSATPTTIPVALGYKSGRCICVYSPSEPLEITSFATIERRFCDHVKANEKFSVTYGKDEGSKVEASADGARRLSIKNNSECRIEVMMQIKGQKHELAAPCFIMTPQEDYEWTFDEFIQWMTEQFPEMKDEVAETLKQEETLEFEVEITELKL